jgi:hypothetical protein
MNEVAENPIPVPTPESPVNKPPSPVEFLAKLPGAPSKEHIASLKQQVPNGTIRLFSPDGKRAFLMRGITGLEMRELQTAIPTNATDPEGEFKLLAVAKACVWASTTPSGKLDAISLRAGTAGLPETLFHVVEELSDYRNPAQVFEMSADL